MFGILLRWDMACHKKCEQNILAVTNLKCFKPFIEHIFDNVKGKGLLKIISKSFRFGFTCS